MVRRLTDYKPTAVAGALRATKRQLQKDSALTRLAICRLPFVRVLKVRCRYTAGRAVHGSRMRGVSRCNARPDSESVCACPRVRARGRSGVRERRGGSREVSLSRPNSLQFIGRLRPPSER